MQIIFVVAKYTNTFTFLKQEKAQNQLSLVGCIRKKILMFAFKMQYFTDHQDANCF